MAHSKSAELRSRIDHPIIDSDGHTVEFMPAFLDVLKEVGGSAIVQRFVRISNQAHWYQLSPKERFERRASRPPWWGVPMKNTLDRAAAALPKLLYQRLDEMGLDFAVLYPTMGLFVPGIVDEEVRKAACRRLQRIPCDDFRRVGGSADARRLHPDAHAAIAELEYAVNTLALKAAMVAGFVKRPIPAFPNEPHSYWLDTFCLDSLYGYDPVWAKLVELGVPPTFHSNTHGIGFRGSVNNYMYNHIGHFAAANEALCKALFFGGVTRRFPSLRFGFLEGRRGLGGEPLQRPDRPLEKAQPPGDGELQSGQPRPRRVRRFMQPLRRRSGQRQARLA